MEMIYKVKKPETIVRFMKENNIPAKILELENNKLKIYVNKVQKRRKDTVKKGDKIHFFVKEEKRDKRVKPENKPLLIVFEDPYLLVVNKPANIQMMISRAHSNNTLANRINYYYEQNNINAKIHYITKLDKEASGLIVIAKHRFIKYLFSNLDKTLTYYFKAITEGLIPLKESSIPLPISRIEGSIKREVAEHGDECITNYKVTKEFKNFSLIDIWVKYVRAHQIRVHFAYFGSPLVGDEVYESENFDKELMLYCYKIEFVHPITEETCRFEIDAPLHFTDFINS